MVSFRKNEGILVQIRDIHILVTIQVTMLKFGSFPYLYGMNRYAKFHGVFFENMGFRPLLSVLFDVKFPLIIVRRTPSSYQALI